MNWNQTKCIRIEEAETVADLFEIGSNWDNRKCKLLNLNNPKATRLADILDRRIDRIMEALKGADIVYFPEWYFDKKVKPLSDLLIKNVAASQGCHRSK